MKNDILSYSIIVMIIFAFGTLNLIGSIYSNEPVKAGSEANLVINVNNPTTDKLSQLYVSAFFIDQGDYVVSPSFSLGKEETTGVKLDYDIPINSYKGDNLVRVAVSNGNVRSTKYVFLRVI